MGKPKHTVTLETRIESHTIELRVGDEITYTYSNGTKIIVRVLTDRHVHIRTNAQDAAEDVFPADWVDVPEPISAA